MDPQMDLDAATDSFRALLEAACAAGDAAVLGALQRKEESQLLPALLLSRAFASLCTAGSLLQSRQRTRACPPPAEQRDPATPRGLTYVQNLKPYGSHAATARGQMAGAAFSVLLPRRPWNGGLLIYAHGHRPEGTPKVCDVNAEDLAYRSLLGDGWVVAATSYRRNGVIIGDAIRDIDNVRSFVVRTVGEPTRCVVEGRSMGGCIGTLIAERELRRLERCLPPLYSGVVAFGAALRPAATEDGRALDTRPGIPLLYVSNASETGPVERYIQECALQQRPYGDGVCLPALWTVSRPGHNRYSAEERLEAIRGLDTWIEFGTFITGRRRDGTKPDQHRDAGFARVIGIDEHGSVQLDMQPVDMERIGLRHGQRFKIKTTSHATVKKKKKKKKKRTDGNQRGVDGDGGAEAEADTEEECKDGPPGQERIRDEDHGGAGGQMDTPFVHYDAFDWGCVRIPKGAFVAYDGPDGHLRVALYSYARTDAAAALNNIRCHDIVQIVPEFPPHQRRGGRRGQGTGGGQKGRTVQQRRAGANGTARAAIGAALVARLAKRNFQTVAGS